MYICFVLFFSQSWDNRYGLLDLKSINQSINCQKCQICHLLQQDMPPTPGCATHSYDFNFYCGLDHEDCNQKLPQHTLAVDDAPLDRVWLLKPRKGSKVQEIRVIIEDLSSHRDLGLEDRNSTFGMILRVMLMHHHTKFHEERLSGSEDIRTNNPRGYEPSLWPWPWRQQPKMSHNTPAHGDAPLSQVWLEKVKKLGYKRRCVFLGSDQTLTLTLKIGTQPFCMTLWVMMMHHHTKFGCIQFSGSQDIFRTKVWQADRSWQTWRTDRWTTLFQYTSCSLTTCPGV